MQLSEVREIADFVSSKNGGNGAVREVIEWLGTTISPVLSGIALDASSGNNFDNRKKCSISEVPGTIPPGRSELCRGLTERQAKGTLYSGWESH